MVLKNLNLSMIIVPVYCSAMIGILFAIVNYSILKSQPFLVYRLLKSYSLSDAVFVRHK